MQSLTLKSLNVFLGRFVYDQRITQYLFTALSALTLVGQQDASIHHPAGHNATVGRDSDHA